MFRGIDYAPSEVVLHFDLTRFHLEGIAGYVFAEAQPGTVPFYRWFHPRNGSHFYTTIPAAPDRPNSVSEGISVTFTTILSPERSRFTTGGTGATTSTRPRRTAKVPAGRATGPGDRRLYLSRSETGERTALPLLRPGPAPPLLHDAPACRVREVDCDPSPTHGSPYRHPRDRPHAIDDPGDLFVGRVAGTAEPDQALVAPRRAAGRRSSRRSRRGRRRSLGRPVAG